jgi:Rgg/GadR/MutR family transcriptional activator
MTLLENEGGMGSMDGRNFGHLFKEMREERKLPIKAISDNTVTSATISRFETGQTLPNVMTFFRILKNANISEEDYLYILNRMEFFSILLNTNIMEAYERRDIVWLEHFLKELQERSGDTFDKRDTLEQIYVKLYIFALDAKQQLSPKEVGMLTRYLRTIGKWGKFELALFSVAVPVLETSFLIEAQKNLTSVFVRNFSTNTQRFFYHCMSALILTFIDRKENAYAQRVVNFIENERIPDTFIREKVYAYFSIALFRYATNPDRRSDNLQKIQNLIKSLESFNATSCASFLDQEMRNFVNKFGSPS